MSPTAALNSDLAASSSSGWVSSHSLAPTTSVAAALDALLAQVGTALATDRSLGGLAENLTWSAPETSVLAIEGAAPILTARITVTIEYLVSDPLAA